MVIDAFLETRLVPWTIVRATQFFEFASMMVAWTRDGDMAIVPALLVQPVALTDVAAVLIEAATGSPRAGTIEIAGPDRHDLVDMARRAQDALGDPVRLDPSWDNPGMAGNVLLRGPRRGSGRGRSINGWPRSRPSEPLSRLARASRLLVARANGRP